MKTLNALYLTAQLTKNPQLLDNGICKINVKFTESGHRVYVTLLAAGPLALSAMHNLAVGDVITAKAKIYVSYNPDLDVNYYTFMLNKFTKKPQNKAFNYGQAKGKIVYIKKVNSYTKVSVDTSNGNVLNFVAQRMAPKKALDSYQEGDSIDLRYMVHAHVQKTGRRPGYKRNLQVITVNE